jgi:hypothetical protein
VAEPLPQARERVACRIGSDEHNRDLTVTEADAMLRRRNGGHLQRTDVGAVGVSEEQQRDPTPGLRSEVEALTSGIGEDKIRVLESPGRS